MTKSELFKAAHKIARETKEIAGSYKIAFSCALKDLYAGVANMNETNLESLAMALAKAEKSRETEGNTKAACKAVVNADKAFKAFVEENNVSRGTKREALANAFYAVEKESNTNDSDEVIRKISASSWSNIRSAYAYI